MSIKNTSPPKDHTTLVHPGLKSIKREIIVDKVSLIGAATLGLVGVTAMFMTLPPITAAVCGTLFAATTAMVYTLFFGLKFKDKEHDKEIEMQELISEKSEEDMSRASNPCASKT